MGMPLAQGLKNFALTFMYMSTNGITPENYIRFILNAEHNSTLIQGKGSYGLLKSAYDVLSKSYDCIWLDDPKNPKEMWSDIMRGLKMEDGLISSLDYDTNAMSYPIKNNLEKRSENVKLFFPNMDKVFYRLDKRGGILHHNNAILRWIRDDCNAKLAIHASVEDAETNEYRRTLGNSHFPLWDIFPSTIG
jgi:hypothetical protein